MGNWQSWLDLYSYWGVLLALLAHFIPTELIMGYAGYLVASNQMSFLLMFAAGLVGFYVSQSILYGLAYFGGERVLSFLTRLLHINPVRMQLVEANLLAYGGWYLLLSPIWKTLFGLLAGDVTDSFFNVHPLDVTFLHRLVVIFHDERLSVTGAMDACRDVCNTTSPQLDHHRQHRPFPSRANGHQKTEAEKRLLGRLTSFSNYWE